MPQIEKAIAEVMTALPDMIIMENEPMSAHTSFRIGGPVRAMAYPASAGDAAATVRIVRALGITPFIMGNGTNLLCQDEPLDLFVIKLDEGMAQIARAGEDCIAAGAGAPLARIAQKAQGFGLGGFEFAAGIPGTLGGAVSMNAGAYGGEMKDVVREVLYLDKTGEIMTRSGGDLGFSYRRSAFTDTEDIVLEAVIDLAPADPEEIQKRMRELSEKRRASQPLDIPSAGSTFKRPEGGYAAALIDQAGLKGYTVGGAQVSEKHAGFVVNKGGATFRDVMTLMDHIRRTVFDRSGIMLEPEVRLVTDK